MPRVKRRCRPSSAATVTLAADLLAHVESMRPDLVDFVRLMLWQADPCTLQRAEEMLPVVGDEATRIVRLLEDLLGSARRWRHPADIGSAHYRHEADVAPLLRLIRAEQGRPTVQGARRVQLARVRQRLETVAERRAVVEVT